MKVEVLVCTHTNESVNPGPLAHGGASLASLGGFFGKGHASGIAARFSHFSSR